MSKHAGNPRLSDQPGHEHSFTILIGHAPIAMAAGASLPTFRECRCGERLYVGEYICGGI